MKVLPNPALPFMRKRVVARSSRPHGRSGRRRSAHRVDKMYRQATLDTLPTPASRWRPGPLPLHQPRLLLVKAHNNPLAQLRVLRNPGQSPSSDKTVRRQSRNLRPHRGNNASTRTAEIRTAHRAASRSRATRFLSSQHSSHNLGHPPVSSRRNPLSTPPCLGCRVTAKLCLRQHVLGLVWTANPGLDPKAFMATLIRRTAVRKLDRPLRALLTITKTSHNPT